MHTETATASAAYVSRHDPVQRWLDANRLSDTQEVAIAFVRRLWKLAGLEQKVTATYGEKTPAGNVERRAINEIAAREDLHRIQDYIPSQYWRIFEAVCRFGEPAGVAGSSLANNKRSSFDAAYIIVCFVADLIAMNERL